MRPPAVSPMLPAFELIIATFAASLRSRSGRNSCTQYSGPITLTSNAACIFS